MAGIIGCSFAAACELPAAVQVRSRAHDSTRRGAEIPSRPWDRGGSGDPVVGEGARRAEVPVGC